VENVNVNLNAKKAFVVGNADEEAVKAAVTNAGYEVL
ncbi:MAG: cation transporter, partial [Clostridia bacterium]|nr:cation transporter [Clostridia bacterium]